MPNNKKMSGYPDLSFKKLTMYSTRRSQQYIIMVRDVHSVLWISKKKEG